MGDIPLSWLVGALAALLLISGFFSIAETSMMAINRYRLKHMVAQGHGGAARVEEGRGTPLEAFGAGGAAAGAAPVASRWTGSLSLSGAAASRWTGSLSLSGAATLWTTGTLSLSSAPPAACR